jgi:hypothetical protein
MSPITRALYFFLCSTVYRKEGTGVTSINSGAFGVYSMNKTGNLQMLFVIGQMQQVELAAP